jgi:small-conductance mechanosensitive channel
VRFLTDRVVPAAAVLAVGVALAFVARALVARLLTRVLPGDEDRAHRQVKGAARGVMWFLIVVAVIVATSLLAPHLLSDIPAQVLRFLPRLGVALAVLWVGAVVANLLRQTALFMLLIAGVAVAIAVGLGGRVLAGDVIAGRYVDDRFTVGERIEVDDWKGTIVEVGLASVTISDSQGELVEIPHGYLLSHPVRRSGN